MTRTTLRIAALLTVGLTLAACSSTAKNAASDRPTPSSTAVSGPVCPQAFDASSADFYPIQPSFSAGYTAAGMKVNSTTANWAYEVSGDFPYSNWMAWYLYSLKGVPLFKFSDTKITPDSGSTNPFVVGNPILAPMRSYHIYFMPAGTPQSVISSMQSEGKNVALIPDSASTGQGVVFVSRSYWSFSNDGLGNYDRFGYHGPTNTPTPTLTAYLTDASTHEITTPVSNCGAQSLLPKKIWYNPATNKPIITFANSPRPTDRDLQDIPHFLLQTGSFGGSMGAEYPPSPVPNEVQFYRNVAAHAPFADVQSAPPAGNPPDACGGYVMANLPNDVVSLVHIPQVPSFPSYKGATSTTVNAADQFNVQFYSVVIYGATKQVDALGQVNNSQIGNTQINKNSDGSATVVLYPQNATQDQINQINAVVRANGWNILRSGIQTAVAPNLLVIREKGQNQQWKNALSANDVTQGAPCPQSTNASLPLPQDPPSAQVTQTNGMGLSAPQGENCTIEEFTSGVCLKNFAAQLAKSNSRWSASSATPPAQKSP